MAEMHLIIFHIGPVQDFIAAARRSRDLWFGSWLLSELSKAAALEIVKQHKNEVNCLIFPAPADLNELQSDKFNVANRVVALVTQPPAELGEAVRKAVLERLFNIRDEAYKNIKGKFECDVAVRQVNDLLELFWASSSISGDYNRARTRAETLLAVRKITHDFRPVTWGSPVPKCSLDGRRESVIPESVYTNKTGMTEIRLRSKYGVRMGERLCGVGLLKRHGHRGQEDSFFSTSHVAALPLLQRLTAHHGSAVKDYIERLEELKISPDALSRVPKPHPVFGYFDGRLLFEERLPEYFEEEDKQEQAKRALHDFLANALDGKRPFPYYALLLADGDLVGKVIDAQKTAEEHQKFSQCLSKFAHEVRAIVDSHAGSLVYSGGDDVLAFVPLHTVLACARHLAEKFCQQLAGFKVPENGKGLAPTLSVGLVVVHHLTPLSDALVPCQQK